VAELDGRALVSTSLSAFVHSNPGLLSGLRGAGTSAQVIALRSQASGEDDEVGVVVVNSHLFFADPAPHVRAVQAALLLEAALMTRGRLRGVFEEQAGVVLCGDLNSDSASGVVELLSKGLLSPGHRDWARGYPFQWGDMAKKGTQFLQTKLLDDCQDMWQRAGEMRAKAHSTADGRRESLRRARECLWALQGAEQGRNDNSHSREWEELRAAVKAHDGQLSPALKALVARRRTLGTSPVLAQCMLRVEAGLPPLPSSVGALAPLSLGETQQVLERLRELEIMVERDGEVRQAEQDELVAKSPMGLGDATAAPPDNDRVHFCALGSGLRISHALQLGHGMEATQHSPLMQGGVRFSVPLTALQAEQRRRSHAAEEDEAGEGERELAALVSELQALGSCTHAVLGYRAVLDWIFVDKERFEISQTAPVFPLGSLALPDCDFPSDHIPVCTDIVFNKRVAGEGGR